MKLLDNSLIYVAVSILQRALGFFLLPVYTAYLGPEDYGTANVVLAIVNFATILCLFSFHGAGTRFEHKLRGNPEAAREMWGTLFLSVLAATAVVTLVLAVFRDRLLAPFLGGVAFFPYMALGLAAMAFSPAYQLFQSNLQAKQLGRRFGLNNLAYFLLNMGLTLLCITAFGMKGDGILLALAATNAVFFAYTLIDFLPRIALRFSGARFKEAFAYSLPLLPHSLAGWLMSLVDRLFLNHYQDTGAVGLYSVGVQFGNLINIVTAAVNQAYAPWMFEQIELGEEGRRRIARVSEAIVLGFSFCALAVSCFSMEVLSFMVAPEFRGSWKVVPWLSFSFVFGGAYYIFVNPLFLKRTAFVPIVTFGSAFLGVALNLVLIPKFGMLGAAASSLASLAVSSVLALILSSRLEPIGFDWIRIYAYAIVPFLLAHVAFLDGRMHPVPFILLKAALVAGMGIACVLLYRTEAETAWKSAMARLGRKSAPA